MFGKKMIMLFQCKKSGKFVKADVEAFRAKEIPTIWRLVDDEEDATSDPAWLLGEDLNMLMLMELREHYDCTEGLTTYTPESSEPPPEKEKVESTLSTAQRGLVIGLGCGIPPGHVPLMVVDSRPQEDVDFEARKIMKSLSQSIIPVFKKCEAESVLHNYDDLPRGRFSHRRPELAYGQKFHEKPRGIMKR